MSAKDKQVVAVQEKLEDITECPICKETYKEPKILPCIHTFCMICLQDTWLKTKKSPGEKMPCPVCRTEFTVPEKGFVGLQRNFFMERLIEMKDILNPSSTRVLCDACQEDNASDVEKTEIPSAVMYCADCNQRLCEECCRHHRKYKVSKDHRMLALDGAQINIPSIVKPCVCDKHENKPLEIYCSSCQEAICGLCYFEGHKTHETSPVINVVGDFRRIIQENSTSVISLILDLKHKMTGEDHDKAVFAQNVAVVESEIKRTRQKFEECVEKDCDSLLQQLNSVKEARIKENEIQLCDIEAVLASLESYQVYCTQVTTIGSDVDICRALHTLRTRAVELKQRYETIGRTPAPFNNITLEKTEFQDAQYQLGINIIGKIKADIGDNQPSNVENKGSLTDRISSFVDELNDFLDKTFVSCDVKWLSTCNRNLCDKLQQIKSKINYIVERNDQLENELDRQRMRVRSLEETNFSLSCETEVKKLTEMASSKENIDLRKQVALLKSIAYDGDQTSKTKQTLQHKGGRIVLQTIGAVDVPDEKTYRVTGLAILDNELFIAIASAVVEVNDLRTLKFKRRFRAEMDQIIDMKATVRNKHLYLLCRSHFRWFLQDYVLRCCATGNVIAKWKLDNEGLEYVQLSVTDESNVLLTNGKTNELIEYSSNGELIRVIPLKWESGIQNLNHGIKLTLDHFVLCHGKGTDLRHRVCIVDIDGNVLKYFGEIGKSYKLNDPIYLERATDGNIYVADHLNQRLLLFNSSLELIQEFSTRKAAFTFTSHEMSDENRPRKMVLDEVNGRIFVAESFWKAPQNGKDKEQHGDQLSVFNFSMR